MSRNQESLLRRISRGGAVLFGVYALYSPMLWFIGEHDVSSTDPSFELLVGMVLAALPLWVFFEISHVDRKQHRKHQEEVREAYQQGYSDGSSAARHEATIKAAATRSLEPTRAAPKKITN